MKKGMLVIMASLAMLLLLVMMTGPAFAQQAIRVLYPDMSARWVAGNDYTVRWTGTSVGKGGVSRNVDIIRVQKSTLNFIQHSGDTPNSGSYVFHVREDIPSGIYKIKVTTRTAWDTLPGDDSPWFKLTNPREGQFIPYK